MDSGKILLVNLSRGRTGDLNSKLLGMIFVMKFEAAAMSRADIPEEYRRDFCLYVDEFQNFSTDSFSDILSQARKYHLNLIVANQFTTQLSEEIRDAVFGNVGSVVCFRVGTNDAEFLAKQYAPIFDIDDLQFLPNYNTAVRMMIGGVPVQSFSMATLPPLGNPNPQLAEALKQLSAAKYGRPKSVVEQDIFKRMATVPRRPNLPPSRASMLDELGLPPARPAQPLASRPAGVPTALPGSSASSFLDEWLAKRKLPPRNAGGNPFGSSPATAASSGSSPSQTAVASTAPAGAGPAQPSAPSRNGDRGELKISRGGDKQETGAIHIDKDGNLTGTP
jgi:hypothetical protein